MSNYGRDQIHRPTNLVLDEQRLEGRTKQLRNRLIIATVGLQGRIALAVSRAWSIAVDVHGTMAREHQPGSLGAVYTGKVLLDERVLEGQRK